jgi:hypothetical protein
MAYLQIIKAVINAGTTLRVIDRRQLLSGLAALRASVERGLLFLLYRSAFNPSEQAPFIRSIVRSLKAGIQDRKVAR